MPAGYFNKVATFKRKVFAQNDAGDDIGSFEPISAELTRFPVGYRPERGWEREEAGRLESATMGVLRARSCVATRSVTPGDIVDLFDQFDECTTFTIKYVDNRDRENKFLHFTVEEGTAVI